ncbi:hypothetical protein [Nocardia nova]|uniref:hypothetical protein n=1 Tax=Nocardia nova TaxID=37330 RepID=UPI0033FDB509
MTHPALDLADHTVVITGAAGGLGEDRLAINIRADGTGFDSLLSSSANTNVATSPTSRRANQHHRLPSRVPTPARSSNAKTGA